MFGLGRGRKRRGDVRAALLRLLDEKPRNGYQLMQAIEERSRGSWRPSPGSVYPTLQQLEDQELIQAVQRDGTKLFELTDRGRGQLEECGGASPWESGEELPAVGELKAQMKQLVVAVTQFGHAADDRQVRHAAAMLAQTRRSLYRILAGDADD
jgi:DNA-binding PadR family transcriptional regulator